MTIVIKERFKMSISKNKVLICDVSGSPHHWASWEDAITLKVKDLLSYEIGDAQIFHGGVSKISGEVSIIDVKEILFLKEVLKYDQRTPPLTNENLFIRDRNTCAYCSRLYPTHKLSRDHIQPVSLGGKNVWENVVSACKPCNHIKDDLPLGVARDSDGDLMKLFYVPYRPSHVERLIMQNRTILADQMTFLADFLPQHSRILQQSNIVSTEELDSTHRRRRN